MSQQHQHITLSELQRHIKQALECALPLPVWVAAEVSELKVNYSGHCYMELVEKSEPTKGGTAIPRAQARAVIWRSQYAMLASYFEAETGSRLAAGMKILAKVLVSYHELYGLSLQIIDLDASYTLGEVERQKQMTIAQLQRDGVWDMN
ncbi:MAG: exodeoxyribonuclease VII large subunit, partial [Alistipes sp.]|nr:exodeoxyribonuclease VII large subunit [Alistipes sp.]